jgi:hypothetical protein
VKFSYLDRAEVVRNFLMLRIYIFSVSYSSKNNLIEYIKNQQEHHKKFDFLDEYKKILEENGIEFDEKYLL